MAGTSFGLTLDPAKRYFFDRLKVQAVADKATLRVLSRFGAYVRTRARSSMKRPGKKQGNKPSPPGQPPRAHSGDKFATLKNILFAYDPASRSVVIGPVLLNGSRRYSPTVPELHEFGGMTTRTEVQLSGGRWVPMSYGKRWGLNRPHRTKPAKYPARPYMRPAFEAELGGRLRSQLRGMIGKAA